MQDMLQEMLKAQVKKQLNTQIANKLGVTDDKAQDMIENSLPYLLGGLSKNVESKEGAASLLEALKSGKHDEANEAEGEGILKHVLGEKEVEAEEAIAEKTGLDAAKVKTTLTVMAPMVMAALSKVVKSDQLDADKLSEVVTNVSKNKDFSGAGMTLVKQLLDKDKDGDIKDDLINIGKNWLSNKLSKK